MAEVQLSLFDAIAARDYQRKQYEAERNAFLLKLLGEKGAKRWHDKNNKLSATLEVARQTPLTPEMLAAIDTMRQRVKASTKPFLAEEFALLGLEPGATKREIKNAYRRQARKLHPDKGGTEEAMKALNVAYKRVLAAAKE